MRFFKIKTLAILLTLVSGPVWADEATESRAAKLSNLAQTGLQSLEWGLLLETEGYYARVDGANESDLVMATVEFKLEAAVTEWLRGNVGLLWEQYSREDDNVDEAFITLGASESIPFYLVAGRFYQPVGNFESAFISDPLTLELMEMNRAAGMVGFANNWIDLNAGAFNGDTKAGVGAGEGGDAILSDFFASAAVTPADFVSVGAYWLSDMMETYNYGQLGDQIATEPGYEKVGGAGVFANVYLGPFTLNAEFASALDDYALADGRYRPAAFNVEGSARLTDQIRMGLKYEASNDLYAAYDQALLKFGEKFPGRAYGAVVAYEFHENAAVGVEYLRVEELDEDARGDVFTIQLALEI